jgi:hypothetical protein
VAKISRKDEMSQTATPSRERELAAILRTAANGMHRLILENGGRLRISEVAKFLGCHPKDKNLQKAMHRVVVEGYYKWEGSTANRRLVRYATMRAARICPKCNEVEVALDNDLPRALAVLDWRCEQHPGSTVDHVNRPYNDPRVDYDAKPKALPGQGRKIPNVEQFGRMSHAAGKIGQTIGSREKASE